VKDPGPCSAPAMSVLKECASARASFKVTCEAGVAGPFSGLGIRWKLMEIKTTTSELPTKHDHCWMLLPMTIAEAEWNGRLDAQNALGVQWDMDSASCPWECFTPLSSCLMPHVSIKMGNPKKKTCKKGNLVS